MARMRSLGVMISLWLIVVFPEIRANYLFFSEKILSFREKKELHD